MNPHFLKLYNALCALQKDNLQRVLRDDQATPMEMAHFLDEQLNYVADMERLGRLGAMADRIEAALDNADEVEKSSAVSASSAVKGV